MLMKTKTDQKLYAVPWMQTNNRNRKHRNYRSSMLK